MQKSSIKDYKYSKSPVATGTGVWNWHFVCFLELVNDLAYFFRDKVIIGRKFSYFNDCKHKY